MRHGFFILVAALVLGACGDDDPGYDNVAACQEWKALVKACGSVDLTVTTVCEDYDSSVTCDVTGYFTCLRDTFRCVKNTPVTSGWTTCKSQATCQ